MYSSKKAFTLIELLIVIAIIGILASVILVSLNGSREKARKSRKISDLAQLSKLVNSYFAAEGSMPVNANAPSGWCIIGTAYAGVTCLGELVTRGYIGALPISPWGTGYYYYDYGTYGLVATRMDPLEYGPGSRGWHCSDATGGSADKWYCIEFNK